jgi:hypothetical protein
VTIKMASVVIRRCFILGLAFLSLMKEDAGWQHDGSSAFRREDFASQ